MLPQLKIDRQFRMLAALAALAGLLTALRAPVMAQEPPAPAETPAAAPAATDGDLRQVEARLAERYERLELLVGRLAELSQSTQPRRANLLRQLVAQSRERDVPGRFDAIVRALEKESYSTAIEGQTELHGELQKLLELLLQEDRDRQIESQRKRIGRYLQDLNKLIRLQRGVKARTDGGDEPDELADDQQRVGDQTQKLGDEIEESEGIAEAKARRAESRPASGEQVDPSEQAESESDSKPSESPNGEPQEKPPGDDQPKPADGESEEPKPADDSAKGDSESEKPPAGQEGQTPPGEPKEGQPSERQPAEGQPSEGQPRQGQPSEGQPAAGQPGQPIDPPPPEESAPPMEKAAERLRQAQQRMAEALKQLEQSKREGAAGEQQEAVEQLEQAKAELERILRQLREEELERMLVMLETRFRKMLDQQVEVYDETKRLDAAAARLEPHELEIAAARQSRQERLIVREADRALLLLREDGTSVAFPEAVEQARDDMQSIADRLSETKTDMITQGLEEDVIAALEETLAALQEAIKDLREQRSQQQQQQQEGGQPGEQPLVKQLAELRMIRSLQVRVNRRTEQYGAMIEGEQALEAELIEALDQLALRQQKIFQATHDLNTKENQ